MSEKNNILIFAAHPDDEILGCGGVIQKYKEEGQIVIVCIVTDGSSSQYKDSTILDKKRKESVLANQQLKTDKVIYLNFPDMKLDIVSHVELNRALDNVCSMVKPRIIFTHSATDLNNDHLLINKSTQIITRPTSDKKYLKEVFEYEILSSTEWNIRSVFKPNTFFDIEKYIDKKIEAFKVYKTENRKHPHPRSPEGIRALAMYRGLQSGYKYAEAFKLLRSFR